ncbi:MAG: tail fiber domain-containing protein, partial [Candidatus Paceibacterota bacterium]
MNLIKNIFKNHLKIILSFAFFIFFATTIRVLAVVLPAGTDSPAGGYDAGTILDPGCDPEDPDGDCIVKIATETDPVFIAWDKDYDDLTNIPTIPGASPIEIVNSTNLFSTGLTGTGDGVTSSNYSIFFGENAGYQATGASDSNFLGVEAGYQATNASASNFLGTGAGHHATNAQFSNFLGGVAGYNATNAENSNFLGYFTGYDATDASYSNLFGFHTGQTFGANNIGSNNIIIGTNISLPNATANAINLGGVIFATGTHATTTGNPSITPVVGGKVGIGTVTPNNTIQVIDLIDFGDPTLSQYNTKLGFQAGKYIVPGAQYNTFLGYQAGLSSDGSSTDLADNNTAVGYQSLYSNTTGYDNMAIGSLSLRSNTTGYHNTAIGSRTLYYNTEGYRNTAVGTGALWSNTTGYYNTALGYLTLTYNTTGRDNVAVGSAALSKNTEGNFNTAVGYMTLYENLTGIKNSGFGFESLMTNSTGDYNAGNGAYSLCLNTTGSSNAASGAYSLCGNTTGSFNSALGRDAGYYITAGTYNQTSDNSVYLGYNTRASLSGNTNEIVIGASAYGNGSNSVTLGNASITKTVLRGDVGIGTVTPSQKLDVVGNINISSGSAYMYNGINVISANISNDNYFFGNSGNSTMTGLGNLAIGRSALNLNETGDCNVSIGLGVLNFNTTGSNNTASGFTSLNFNTTGSNNTANGYSALGSNTTGSNNTAIGFSTLSSNTTGSNNTAIGYNAEVATEALTNATAIGYNAIVGASNSLVLGGIGADAVNVGIGMTIPTARLHLPAGTTEIGTAPLKFTSGPLNTTAEVGAVEFLNDAFYGTITTGAERKQFAFTTDIPSASPITIVNGNNLFSTLLSGTGSGVTSINNSIFLGGYAGINAINASNSSFFGFGAGDGATNASFSNFFGNESGRNATEASNSNFFGFNAGYGATNASFSNFFGRAAGYGATDTHSSNFFGSNSGYGATNIENSNFFGSVAGYEATYASNSNFFGFEAGYRAPNSSNSNFLGFGAGKYSGDSSYSNFLGYKAGNSASGVSYSNLFGYQTGMSFTGNDIGLNNIIIGTNISLPNATSNAINLGGVIFATGTHSTTTGDPSIVPVSGGKVGIGAVVPLNIFHVAGDPGQTIPIARIENLSEEDYDQNYGLLIVAGNNLGANDSQMITFKRPDATVLGSISQDSATTVAFNTSSDRRIKENITSTSFGLSDLAKIKVLDFNFINDPKQKKMTGFIAQDLYNIFPGAVTRNGDDGEVSLIQGQTPWMVDYSKLTPLVIKSIQELNLKVEDLSSLDTESATSLGSMMKSFIED